MKGSFKNMEDRIIKINIYLIGVPEKETKTENAIFKMQYSKMVENFPELIHRYDVINLRNTT